MNNNVKFYRCATCGNVIELSQGNIENIACCGSEMQELKPNTVDAAVEKHVPSCKVVDDELEVIVGEVEHPMQEDHYIMWIAQVSGNKITKVMLKPGEKPAAKFCNIPNSKVYAYCDKHGLWMAEV